MELVLTDEQRLLRESAVTLVERHAGADRARKRRDAGGALDREAWREMAEAGWLAILAAEDAGGFGLGVTELALVAEQAGRALAGAPVCAAAVSALAIGEGDSANLRDSLLADLIAGETVVVPALQESPIAVDTTPGDTRAAADGDGFRLSGAKGFVPDAANADGFLVSAVGPDGTVLVYVPKDAPGIAVETRGTVDGGGMGRLSFDGVAVPREAVVAGANRAPEVVARIQDLMLIGLAGELLGVMDRALEIALDYIKVRNQFDRPIGSFQALQHRAVDDYASVEVTRSLLFQVCTAVDEGRGAPEMAAAAKAKASAAALSVAKSAIQMHGGIGFTDEHDIGLYLKRAMALSAQYGNETVQRRRYAELAGIEPAA